MTHYLLEVYGAVVFVRISGVFPTIILTKTQEEQPTGQLHPSQVF